MMTDMGSYFDFVMILLLAFGAAFEVPVATVLLVWTGFVKIATLKQKSGFVVLGLFIFAAFVTPPDAVSQSRRWRYPCTFSIRNRDQSWPDYPTQG
jgi:sec-independent protein translocase protein TatC